MYLRRDWWAYQFFSSCSGQGKKTHVNAKDAKSIPSPRKLKRAKLKDSALYRKEPCIVLTLTLCLCCGSEQAQTHQVCLTSTKELAGLSKLDLNPAHTKINLRFLFVPQDSLKSRTACKRERKSHVLVFKLQIFPVSIPAVCFLGLEQSLISKSCCKPISRTTELREFWKKRPTQL